MGKRLTGGPEREKKTSPGPEVRNLRIEHSAHGIPLRFLLLVFTVALLIVRVPFHHQADQCERSERVKQKIADIKKENVPTSRQNRHTRQPQMPNAVIFITHHLIKIKNCGKTGLYIDIFYHRLPKIARNKHNDISSKSYRARCQQTAGLGFMPAYGKWSYSTLGSFSRAAAISASVGI